MINQENGDNERLTIDETTYACRLTKKYLNRKAWSAKKKEEIRSIIPGTVITICVKEGDKVNAGELLMLYEAMKMENRIYAPIAGVVGKISVKNGDKLPKHALMIQMS